MRRVVQRVLQNAIIIYSSCNVYKYILMCCNYVLFTDKWWITFSFFFFFVSFQITVVHRQWNITPITQVSALNHPSCTLAPEQSWVECFSLFQPDIHTHKWLNWVFNLTPDVILAGSSHLKKADGFADMSRRTQHVWYFTVGCD